MTKELIWGKSLSFGKYSFSLSFEKEVRRSERITCVVCGESFLPYKGVGHSHSPGELSELGWVVPMKDRIFWEKKLGNTTYHYVTKLKK